jgi:hypothetical protein
LLQIRYHLARPSHTAERRTHARAWYTQQAATFFRYQATQKRARQDHYKRTYPYRQTSRTGDARKNIREKHIPAVALSHPACRIKLQKNHIMNRDGGSGAKTSSGRYANSLQRRKQIDEITGQGQPLLQSCKIVPKLTPVLWA